MIFSSDNASGAHPALIEALVAANAGPAMPYGADPITTRVEARIREVFEAPEARVLLVGTGTAANAIALASLCPPWATIYGHAESHIERDECGAPEFFTGGAKITLIGGGAAKIDPAALALRVAERADESVHGVQNGALSITQATERGAVYTPAQVAELAAIARAHGLPVQMDGTRFANAVARLGCSPAELSWKAGVDVLCLGATKNGALGAEAIVFFDGSRGWETELRRKRGGHLFSKMRFVAAQLDAWLEDGLWLRLAAHANAMADRLAAGMIAAGAELLAPVEANMLFARIPEPAHRRLQAAGARYYPWPTPGVARQPGDPVDLRLVCSWATTAEEVDAFLSVLAEG